MKTIVYTEYGGPDVLHIQEIEKPLPKENEVLIKVHAASVNYGDLIARNFKNISPGKFNMPLIFWILARFSFGFSKPKLNRLGNSFSGEIETIGKEVKQFKKGQKVLIICASGGSGSAAVQLAKHHFGAEVTGVCGTQRLTLVKNLGADKVIDYEKSNQ